MKPSQTEDPLQKAAVSGDVEFLRNCIASNQPIEYYLGPSKEAKISCIENIFHLAVVENREEFIREATKSLPFETVKQLLLQQCGQEMYNPLHKAAVIGNVEIIKLFLNVFRASPPLPVEARPWLAKTKDGQTPCHVALYCGQEDCGLELLPMDMELVCDMVDNNDFSLLGVAVFKGLNKVALEILRSPCSFSCLCPDHNTALHYVTNCTEGEDICRRLLERKPEQINQTSKSGLTVLHSWATEHKLWPFQCLLNSNDIIPNVKRIFADLITATDLVVGHNPLHVLAANHISTEQEDIEIAKLLMHTYQQELAVAQTSRSSISEEDVLFPWLMQDKQGGTPLVYAIDRGKEQFAMYIMSVDDNVLLKSSPETLLFAIEKGCPQVARHILEIVDEKGLTQFLTNEQQLSAMHLAPICKKAFFEQMLKRHPDLLERVDKDGNTIFHIWVKIGEVWPFEYVLQSAEIDQKRRSHLVKLICASDYKDRNSPLHVVATTEHEQEKTHQIAKMLVEAYKQENPNWRTYSPAVLPWFQKNKDTEGPMHLAMRNQNEMLALYMLSQNEANRINQLLDYYKVEHKTLFLAIEKNCFQVAKEILAKLDKGSWTKYLMDPSNGRSVLHLAPSCTDKDFGIWLVNEAPELINQPDKSGKTPLDEASNIGAEWIIKAILKKDPCALTNAPLAWVNASEKGHISVIRAFIDYYPGKFRNHCIKHKDSPLHHIQLSSNSEYEEFLRIPAMMDLINVQDFRGETPLHKAIQNRNMFLTETLLNMDKIMYNIKNVKRETAVELLEQVCNEDYEWDQMCKSIGFDPRVKTTYFQRKIDLFDVRNSLLVVAALLAAITFTAGFTLPGGLDQNTGQAMLAKKAAFIVFLLSDTLAMSLSMLVLVCLLWSMIYTSSSSVMLIDRSMILIIISLYSTLLAFVTGVFVVIASQSFWVAIVIIIMCSIVGIAANRTLLYKVLSISSKKKGA